MMYDGNTHSVATIAKTVGVSRSTLYRYLQQHKAFANVGASQSG